MRVACIGGGPAGLYFGILAKQRFPDWTIRVLERNRPLDTFGWGVVFSDATLENLRAADEPTHREITQAFAHWDDIEVHFRGHTMRSGGHGFCGISRKRLLQILQARAAELGVDVRFEADVTDVDALRRDCDLLVGADGVNSRVRAAYAEAFKPSLDRGRCRFVWLGTTLPLDAFTFIFERTEHGWFTVHAYRFDEELSTFIVECREETYLAHGLDSAGTEETIAFCERLFEPYLRGHRLMANSAHLRGPRLAELHEGQQRELGQRRRGTDGRRRAHGALFGRLRNEARDGRRHRPRRGAWLVAPSRCRSPAVRRNASRRGSEAAERSA